MIEKDISQYLSLEQRARNLFGENYDLENCVEELRQYRNTTLSPEQVRTLQKRFLDVSIRLCEYMEIGKPEECRAAMKKKPEKPMAELGVFGEPEEKDLDRLKSLHHKILYSKIAEIVTEQEMIAFLRAQYALEKQLSECSFLNSGGDFYE